jgi:hypothetical protein
MLPPQTPPITPKNNSAENQRYSLENSADSIQNVGAGLAPALKVLMEGSHRMLPPQNPPIIPKIIALKISGIFGEIPLIFNPKHTSKACPHPSRRGGSGALGQKGRNRFRG